MFPLEELQNEIVPQQETAASRSFLFDFAAGDFVLRDGDVVRLEGIEALQIWIEKIIRTEIFKFKIYRTGEPRDYGMRLRDLITGDLPKVFTEAEIQREITEVLESNPEITGIEDFRITRERRTFHIVFTVRSIYGTARMEVLL